MGKSNYQIRYTGDNWIMVETDDDNLFDSLYEHGWDRVVLSHELVDGTFEYIIGKKTVETDNFPVGPEYEEGSILHKLSLLEEGWHGSTQYGGAPMNMDGSRSLLTPQMIIDVVNSCIGDTDVRDQVLKVKHLEQIDPYGLFSEKILNYKVQTQQLGRVDYVNLDNAATTPPFLAVQDGVNKYLQIYGSVHRGAGYKSKISTDIYEETRSVIKDFVGAPENFYVMFNPNTTGAMNMAAYFFSFLEGKVAVSAIEHSSSWLPWIKAEGEKALKGKQVDLTDVNDLNERIQQLGSAQVLRYPLNEFGEFDLSAIEDLLKNNKIKVFVLTASSNLTGYCPPIKEIGKIVHRYGAYYVVDACQYLQHHRIDMMDMEIDFLAASGHKFYAPYGGGFLMGPKNFLDEFLPYQIGGGNLPYITKDGIFLRYKNQLAHDPGTPNAVGAVAMAIAFKQLETLGVGNVEIYEKGLVSRAYEEMSKISKIKLLVDKEKLSTVIPFVVDGFDSRLFAEKLNSEFGIGVRAGSFCVYDVVRDLLKIDDESLIVETVKSGDTSQIPSIVRASFALCNRESDVDRFIQAVKFLINNK